MTITTPPGWNLQNEVARKRQAQTAVWGRPGITFDPHDGAPASVDGAPHSGDDFEGSTPGTLYTVWFDMSLLPRRPDKRDQVRLSGIDGYEDGTYWIIGIRDDGQHGVWCDLQSEQR